jgi:hypothetical protein
MGTIKTTNIEPIADNGTVTLGSSGDTFTISSGVTATNFVAGVSSSSTSGTAISIDSSNRVTMSSNPGFFAQQIAGTTFDSGRFTGGTLIYNTGSHYNSTTGVFTCPIAGKYLIYCAVLVEGGSGRLEGGIYINGGLKANFNGTGTTYDGPMASIIFNCAANDTITIDRLSGNAHNPAHPNNYFGAQFLG